MSPNKTKEIKETKQPKEEDNSKTFIAILLSTFTSVFLAELGDKTQIATMMLSAQSGKPLIVFIGSALALVCCSLVGVLLGRWIAQNQPRDRFTIVAGILMITLGLWLAYQSLTGYLNPIN
tara:strand:+ start:137 stop:499 length:363 start_codon:yes stop_codon:yes gene_type:complete